MKTLIALLASSALVAAAPPTKITWDANADGEGVTMYNIYEVVSSTARTKVASTTGTDPTKFVDVPSGSHAYVITAVNAAGESQISTAITVKLADPAPMLKPKAPSSIKAQ